MKYFLDEQDDLKKEEVIISENDNIQKIKGVKWDSLTMKIYDADRLIRTLEQKAPDSSGVYKWTWYMDEAGAERPSKSIMKRKSEPGGALVKPGTYRVIMTYGDQTSEETIIVKSDPRLEISVKNTEEVYTASKELERMQKTAAEAVAQLVESKNVAENFQKDLKTLDGMKYKAEIKSSKDVIKKIDSLIAIYLGKEDKRQGITRNSDPTVMLRIGTASSYVKSRKNGITTTERTLMEHAKNDLQSALEKTNAFFEKDWKTYKSNIESLQASPFKSTKTFKL